MRYRVDNCSATFMRIEWLLALLPRANLMTNNIGTSEGFFGVVFAVWDGVLLFKEKQ